MLKIQNPIETPLVLLAPLLLSISLHYSMILESLLGKCWLFVPMLLVLISVSNIIPGFKSIIYAGSFKKSSLSKNYPLYIFSTGKVLVALILYLYQDRYKSIIPGVRKDVSFFSKGLYYSLLISVIEIGLGIASGFVALDFGGVSAIHLSGWLLNMFFVCVTEEIIFRQFVDNVFYSLLTEKSNVASSLGALMFGLCHYRGGPVYIFLASVAGHIYGKSYRETGSIKVSAGVHGSFNLLHLLLFSYPSLESTKKPLWSSSLTVLLLSSGSKIINRSKIKAIKKRYVAAKSLAKKIVKFPINYLPEKFSQILNHEKQKSHK